MQWPSEIGYPKVRQSESFWTIIRMLIFLSIIFSHSHHQHNTRGGVMDWHSKPASLPSPGGPGIRRLRTFGGWGGSATWNKVLFFSISNFGVIWDRRNHKFFFMPKVTTKIFKMSFSSIHYILLIIFTRVPDLLWFHIAMRLQLVVNPSVMSKLIKGHIAGIVTTISNGVKIILQF